jgi:hypothetical protein
MQEAEGDIPLSRPKKRRRNVYIIPAILAALLLSVGTYFYFTNRTQSTIPQETQESVSFPVYYPSELPEGYQLKKDSIKVDRDIVFYSFSNDDKNIMISEQAIPPTPPDLAHIEGFKHLTIPAGDAATGVNNGQPTALLLTDTTLVSITGIKGVSEKNVSDILQSMESLSIN